MMSKKEGARSDKHEATNSFSLSQCTVIKLQQYVKTQAPQDTVRSEGEERKNGRDRERRK
jgi:hypothetical protein